MIETASTMGHITFGLVSERVNFQMVYLGILIVLIGQVHRLTEIGIELPSGNP